jgi:hypothetical protein
MLLYNDLYLTKIVFFVNGVKRVFFVKKYSIYTLGNFFYVYLTVT